MNAGGVVDSGGSTTGAESLNNVTLAGGTLRGTGGYFGSWGAFCLLGTLTVSADSAIQNGGGTYNVISPGAGSGLLTINVASGATLTAGLPFADYNSGATKYILTKTGAGTAIFTAANTYTGTTTVSNGTLLVNGSNSGGGAFTVASGATLGGTGTIGGNVGYASGALAKFTQGSPLTIAGSLTLSGNVVHLALPSNLAAGSYTLATFNSSGSSGSFASTPVIDSGSLADGTTAKVNTNTGTVVLALTLTAYAGWASTQGLTGATGSALDPAFGADPNKDGIPNGMAWILGAGALGNAAANRLKLPAVTRNGSGAMVLTFDRLAASAASAPLVVQYGDDLGTTPWAGFTVGTSAGTTTDGNISIAVAPGAGSTSAYDHITVTISATYMAAHPKTFARLMAAQTP